MTTRQTAILINILTGIVILFYAFYYLATPLGSDDYHVLYSLNLHGTDQNGDFSFWEGIKGYWIGGYNYDNSRIAQIIMPFVLYYIPRWGSSLISVAAFIAILAYFRKLSASVFRNLIWFTAFMVLFICAIPWHDTMFYTAFQLNYTWPAALMSIIFYFLVKGTVRPSWMFLLCLITGLWQESFGITIIGGCIMMMICLRHVRTDLMVSAIGAAVAVALLGSTPGTAFRASGSFVPQLHYILFHPVSVAYLALWFFMLARRRWRDIALEPVFVIFAGSIGAAVLLNMLITYHRVGFPAYLLSSFALPALLMRLVNITKFKRATTVLCCLVWCFLMAHLTAAACGIWRVNRGDADLVKVVKKAPRRGSVFADIPVPQDFSPLALRKPCCHNYYIYCSYKSIGNYYGISDFAIFPTEFRTYHSQGIKVPGNTGLMFWRGHIIGPEELIKGLEGRQLRLNYGATAQSCIPEFNYFTTDDGHRWGGAYLLRPGSAFWDENPPEITIVE